MTARLAPAAPAVPAVGLHAALARQLLARRTRAAIARAGHRRSRPVPPGLRRRRRSCAVECGPGDRRRAPAGARDRARARRRRARDRRLQARARAAPRSRPIACTPRRTARCKRSPTAPCRERPRLIDHFRCQREIIAICDALCGYGLRVHTRARGARRAGAVPRPRRQLRRRRRRAGAARRQLVQRAELALTLELVRARCSAAASTPSELAVITPYRGQLEQLRSAFGRSGIPIDCSVGAARPGRRGRTA